MRICFVIDNIYPSHGGIGKSTERYVDLLKKRGHKIIFISSKDKNNKKSFQLIDSAKIYRMPGIKIPFTKGIYYQAAPLPSTIKAILQTERIDLVYIVSYTYLKWVSEIVAKRLGIPAIMHLHFQPENVTKHVQLLDNRASRKIIETWIWLICKTIKTIIVPTEFAKKMLRKYGVKNTIKVISNGINLQSFNKTAANNRLFREVFNLNDNRFFLFVGRFMSEKNISLLVDATSKIDFSKKENKDLVTVLVGDGDLKQKLMSRVKKKGLDNRIIFTGKIDSNLLKSAYSSCDLFVLPSLVELEGIVLLEAMAYGKALLVADSKTSAAPNLVNKNGYLFNPYDSDELAQKMTHLINNKMLLETFGNKSITDIKKYDIGISVDNIEVILNNLVENT